MKTPNITANRRWSAARVREACIRNDLYTRGSNEDYEHMLVWVNRFYPNLENMYTIAENIQQHSKDQTITNIMYILENEVVITTFEIDGDDMA